MDGARSDLPADFHAVRDRIAELARASGRHADDVRLIAVSKTHSAERVAQIATCGQRDFGESTVQEALPKIAALASSELVWHFIGHLQSNKAKFIPGHFTWVHSLDSAKLATRLSRLAEERGTIVNGLIEVNIGRDPNKHGVMPELVVPLLDGLLAQGLRGLSLRGLMTIAPHSAPSAEIRHCFASLRTMLDQCRERFGLPQFCELSMGMSDDFPLAIAEGATFIRLGTAIFGTRHYREAP